MKVKIIYFKNFFYKNAFNFITKIILSNSIILISGGNSIKKIIQNSKKKVFINKVRTIILSDERIYNSINDIRTNYTNLKKNFFKFYKLKKLSFIYFSLGRKYKTLIQNSCNKIKNKIPDAAILSLGADGHICSIFQTKNNIKICKFIDIVKPNNKIRRVTFNVNFLRKIKKIYIVANGKKKGQVLNRILLEKKTKFPLINLNKIIFILDGAAHQKIKQSLIK
jgi:6-phosphogluconolactonase/glucosamine-6-phosphate isomerase/deaminase